MLKTSSIREWWRLPSRIALLLGVGALSAAGAKAEPGAGLHRAPDDGRIPQQSAKSFGDIAVWVENGRIFVSEAGGTAEELQLGDTAEARHLRQMLERDGATAAAPRRLRDRVILVGAGGAGVHWDAKHQGADDAGAGSGQGATRPSSGSTADNSGRK
jgi:hypothetical protein